MWTARPSPDRHAIALGVLLGAGGALAAGLLASVLPDRAAARSSPVAALAVD